MRVTKGKTIVTDRIASEVAEEIEQEIGERGQAFDEACSQLRRLVEQFCEGDEDFFEMTQVLWAELMVIGLRAMERVWACRRQVPERQAERDAQGRKYRYRKEKDYVLRCVFGEGKVRGSQYVRGDNARSGDELCPQMRRMGLWSLGGAFGPKLALECAHAASQMPFETAKEQLERFFAYVPSKRSLMGIADKIGPVAQKVLSSAQCPEGDVIVVQLDGRGTPRISEEEYEKRCKPHQKGAKAKPRRRRNNSRYLDSKRAVGKKKSKKQEVTVAIIYGLRRVEGGWEVVDDKQYFARMGDREAVMEQVANKLSKLEDQPDRLLFLTDGAPHYETLHQRYLPQAEHIVDYYHVCEYLWDAAAAIHNDRTQRLSWVRLVKSFLLEGQPDLALAMLHGGRAEIPKRGPGMKARRKAVDQAIGYIKHRRDRMPYDELLAEGLEIGSGAIESAVRQVVELRLDGPGMRWGDERPNLMLDLVCTRLSNCWEELEQQFRHRLRRCPEPMRRITPVGVAERRHQRAAA